MISTIFIIQHKPTVTTVLNDNSSCFYYRR